MSKIDFTYVMYLELCTWIISNVPTDDSIQVAACFIWSPVAMTSRKTLDDMSESEGEVVGELDQR